MNKALIKKLNQVKNNNKLNNNQKLSKVSDIIKDTHDDLLQNQLYNSITTKHINTCANVSTDVECNFNALSDSNPKKSKQEEKLFDYLISDKSSKLSNYVYQTKPITLITTKDFNCIFNTLIKSIKNYHNQITNSKIYDIYTARSDNTLTDTTYVVITGQMIKNIENRFMQFEHVYLIPAGFDNHTHFEYQWIKDLFKMGMAINTKNNQKYIKKAQAILDDIVDTTGIDTIAQFKNELIKPETTLKRKKDLLFETALEFAEQVLYEKY